MNSSILFRKLATGRATTARSFSKFVKPKCSFASLPSLHTMRALVPSATKPVLSNVRFFSASSDTLLDMLSREHDEEVANKTTDMPESLVELKEKLAATWKIVDTGAVTKLHKTVGAFKVQVSFHCQDETEPEVPIGNDEEEEEPGISVRFTVTATKAGKSLVMVCVSEESVVYIKNAIMSTTDVDAIHATGIDENEYQGPEFTELAADLQDAFVGFLEEELGVNDDVAAYVAMQADYQEQCQYVKFLEDAKNIVA